MFSIGEQNDPAQVQSGLGLEPGCYDLFSPPANHARVEALYHQTSAMPSSSVEWIQELHKSYVGNSWSRRLCMATVTLCLKIIF